MIMKRAAITLVTAVALAALADCAHGGQDFGPTREGRSMHEFVRAPVQQATSEGMTIVAPQPGSSITPGEVRVQVSAPQVVATMQTVDVELSWLPSRSADPAARSQPPAVRVKTWQAPLDRLTQGVVLPRDVTNAWLGPTLVRVRLAGAPAGPWSEGVSFNLTSIASQTVRTPAGVLGTAVRPAPDWSGVSNAAAPAAGTANASPASRMAQTPHSSLGSAAPASAFGPRP